MDHIQSRNFGRGRSKKVRLIVIHTMETGEAGGTARRIAEWMAGPRAPRASSHYFIDAKEALSGVHERDTAWAAPGANADGVQFEHAGRAAQGDSQWHDAESRAILMRSAAIAAGVTKRHGIPIRHLTNAELRAGKAGFIGHNQASEVYKRSSHWDPGPGFPWDDYLALVKAHRAKLDGKPWTRRAAIAAAAALGLTLAWFAGTGLRDDPAPRPTPSVTAKPTPRPTGTVRPTPRPKPTKVKPPVRVRPLVNGPLRIGARGADVRDVQRAVGVRVDGIFGRQTERAVKAAQRKAGRKADGVVGPLTAKALGLRYSAN